MPEFGDIYARSGLTLQEREMITLASLLTAGGCETQLKVHIAGVLHIGLSHGKIVETFLHCIPYTGFYNSNLFYIFHGKDRHVLL